MARKKKKAPRKRKKVQTGSKKQSQPEGEICIAKLKNTPGVFLAAYLMFEKVSETDQGIIVKDCVRHLEYLSTDNVRRQDGSFVPVEQRKYSSFSDEFLTKHESLLRWDAIEMYRVLGDDEEFHKNYLNGIDQFYEQEIKKEEAAKAQKHAQEKLQNRAARRRKGPAPVPAQ